MYNTKNKTLKGKIRFLKKDIKELKILIKKEIELKKMGLKEIKIKKLEIKNIKKILNNNKKSEKIIIEIKSGAGGAESELFMKDLKKMYEKYFKKINLKKKSINFNDLNDEKSKKEIILMVSGFNIYKNLKFESGVHRVQRSPLTENKGKIHTSTCRVAVYRKKSIHKIKIRNEDLKFDYFKSSGSGGQHVNKTNSAVRVTHLPSNTVVECQKERSQHKNKKLALKLISLKLSIKNEKDFNDNNKILKQSLLGFGLRSEKIRTYNFKNNVLIDHRFKFSINNLENIINGRFDLVLKKIKIFKKKLKIF